MTPHDLYELQPSEFQLVKSLLSAVITDDRRAFDEVFDAANLVTNKALRADISGIAMWMAFSVVQYRRRFRFRVFGAAHRIAIVDNLVSGPFGDLLDPVIARTRLEFIFDKASDAPDVSVASMNTAILLCGYLFRHELRHWERTYRALTRTMRRRWGVRQGFRT
jgi:hypothetical protein